jgi:Tol biopolymer transport system component
VIDGNGLSDVYVRDLGATTTTLASTVNGGVKAPDKGALAGALDTTGTHVAFSTTATNIVGVADSNGVRDVYLHTLGTTDTILVSRGPGGAAGNAASSDPSISGDGNRIAFDTLASDLVDGAGGQTVSILVRDLAAGTTTLVSRADGPDGAGANGVSRFPAISADGHCVAFDSQADNLVGGPPGTDFVHGYMRALDADCGTPPPPPGPPPTTTPDTTAPTITGLKVSPATFRVSSKSTAVSAKRKRAPKGTRIRFTLSEAAKVSLKIERKGKGRKKGSKCVAKRKTGKRCTLYKAKGSLRRTGKAGANSVAFSGRIGSKKLAKGRYRITATATDAAGNKAKKKTVSFRVV